MRRGWLGSASQSDTSNDAFLDGGLVSPLLGQPGFLDPDDRDHRFSKAVDPLLMRASLTEFEAFRPKLARATAADGS